MRDKIITNTLYQAGTEMYRTGRLGEMLGMTKQ